MDAQIITNVEGLAELEEAFTEGSKRAIFRFLMGVELKAADILVAAAKQNAPYEDGDLESSIGKQVTKAGGAVGVRVGPTKAGWYGLVQEFGAPEINQPAQHWLEEAAKGVADEVWDAFYNGLTKGLEDMKRG